MMIAVLRRTKRNAKQEMFVKILDKGGGVRVENVRKACANSDLKRTGLSPLLNFFFGKNGTAGCFFLGPTSQSFNSHFSACLSSASLSSSRYSFTSPTRFDLASSVRFCGTIVPSQNTYAPVDKATVSTSEKRVVAGGAWNPSSAEESPRSMALVRATEPLSIALPDGTKGIGEGTWKVAPGAKLRAKKSRPVRLQAFLILAKTRSRVEGLDVTFTRIADNCRGSRTIARGVRLQQV